MKPSDNGVSRQRVVRVPHVIDDWLQARARKKTMANPDRRNGVATEINAILKEAHEAASGKSSA